MRSSGTLLPPWKKCCQCQNTTDNAASPRSTSSEWKRSGADFIDLQGEGFPMVEVGLARRVPQCPIGDVAALLLDHHGKADGKWCTRIGRRKPRQVGKGVEIEAPRRRLHSDLGIQRFICQGGPFAITPEGIVGPFARRRKIELVISVGAFRAHEKLAAGMAPQLPADARRPGGRHAKLRDLA